MYGRGGVPTGSWLCLSCEAEPQRHPCSRVGAREPTDAAVAKAAEEKAAADEAAGETPTPTPTAEEANG